MFGFQMVKLHPTQYGPLLKDNDLCCWRCDRALGSMPKLKAHLQDEFDKLTEREKAKLERKRKRADASSSPIRVSVTDEKRPEKAARVIPNDGSDNSAGDVIQAGTSVDRNE